MKHIYVLGSLNMDIVFESSVLPKQGETLFGDSFLINAGGKGANQAVACAKQGIPTYLIGAVGNDIFGEELLNTAKKYGVNTKFIVKKEISTGTAGILLHNNDNRILINGGANQAITKEDVDTALENIKKGDIFITQEENNLDMVEYSLTKAKEKGAICIFNPAPAKKISEESLKCVDFLIMNETECFTLSGYDASNTDKVRLYLKSLGIQNCIITLGSKGALSISEDDYYHFDALKIKAVDTTAAGDTFVGSFAAMYIMTSDVKESIIHAIKSSALTCLKKGAQQSIPTYFEVMASNS